MRFSIRDILLLTVIVGVATGWALDRWRLSRQVVQLEGRVRHHQAEELRSRLLLEFEQQNTKTREEDNKQLIAMMQQIADLGEEQQREKELNELVKRGYLDLPPARIRIPK